MESGFSIRQQEKRYEEHLFANSVREQDGQLMVKLPFAKDPKWLGDLKEIAYKSFLVSERKLSQDEQLKQQYIDFMTEYRELGYMEEVDL